MRITSQNTTGVIIDIQEKLISHMQEPEMVINNSIKLIQGLRILEVPILVTEQYKKGLGETLPEVKVALEGISPMEKISFSCLDDSVFSQALSRAGGHFVLLAGIESHVCVLQTAIDLLDNDFTPVIVADCVSSRSIIDKKYALKRLLAEGALVTTTESILFELCRVAGTDQFKAISKLVK